MIENELYSEMAATVLPVIDLTLQGYCLLMLILPFMKRKDNVWRIWLAYSLMMLILYVIPYSMGIYMAVGIGTCTALLVMCLTDRRNYRQKAFLAMAFYSLCWLAAAMAEILYDNLYHYAETTDYMINHPNQWFALYIVMCIVYLFLESATLFTGIKCIHKVYICKSADMAAKELCLLSVPLFTGAAGYKIIRYYRVFYILKNGKNTDSYDMLALLYYTASIIAVIVVIGLYQSIRAKQEEKLQNDLLATQINDIRQHIEQAENLYQNIRSIRHDMANHIITLERLYAGGNIDEAKAYSTDLKATLAEMTIQVNSGNPVTDVILQEIQTQAEKKEIPFHIDFHFPAGSNVNAFDISVILNNALQNALENTKKSESSYISILSYRRNNAYMIEIRNSFTGNLKWDMENGLPITSKGNTGHQHAMQDHGYGLANIRKAAEKYSGDIAVSLREGTFCLSIMLMIET